MDRRTLPLFTLGLAAASILACSSVKSDEVATADMSMDAIWTDDGTTGIVTVHFYTSSVASVELVEGDQLTGTIDDVGYELASVDVTGSVGTYYFYGAVLPALPVDSEMMISLERESNNSAPSTSLVLPAPPTLLAPAEGTVFLAGEQITLTWEPSDAGDPMSLSIDGECISAMDMDLEDSGSVSIPVDDLGWDPADSVGCSVHLSLHRTRAGTIDPALAGGEVLAESIRSVEVQVGNLGLDTGDTGE